MRDINLSQSDAQKRVENSFAKPLADRTPKNIEELYFKGSQTLVGQRINKDKNHSSNERVFGLDHIAGSANLRERGQSLGKRQFGLANYSH